VAIVRDRQYRGSGEGIRSSLPRVATASGALLVVLASFLSGCATKPTAPSVMALPGFEKPLEQFHAEDTFCRQWAAERAQETAERASAGELYSFNARQQWYDMAYLQCMYAKGNRIPGVLPGPPPPPPTAPIAPSPSPPASVAPPPAQRP
jgi:hypothetical protein